MGTRSFSLTARVPVPASAAIDFLAALDRHHGLHPFLVSAEVTARSDGPDGPATDWAVVERPHVGPLRYRLRFAARLVRTSPTGLRTEVHPAPGCRLVVVTQAVDRSDGGAEVREDCTVRAPWFLLGHTTRGALEAHGRTFRLLPGVLAG